MTDKEFKRNALIVVGIVIVALLLWWWMHRASSSQTPAQQVAGTSPVSFIVPGSSNEYGPITFPQGIFNIVQGSSPLGTLQAGNCSCGCDGGGGNTTVNFSMPGLQPLLNSLAANAQAAESASLKALYATMGYPERVFVSNTVQTQFTNALPWYASD